VAKIRDCEKRNMEYNNENRNSQRGFEKREQIKQ
jgi:hypothetical protein